MQNKAFTPCETFLTIFKQVTVIQNNSKKWLKSFYTNIIQSENPKLR